MDETPDRPPFMLMIDPYCTVYRGRRRTIVTGEAPAGLASNLKKRCAPSRRSAKERTEELEGWVPIV